MKDKKKTPYHATFVGVFTIIGFLASLQGCSLQRGIPEERYKRAEELVDTGTELLRARKLPEAKRAYELASELAPVAAAVDGKGCVALLEGRFDQAAEYFRKAYEMDRTYDEALANLGLLHEMRGEPDKARAIYLKYLDKWPDSALVRNNLAALEYDRGRDRMITIGELEKARTLSDEAVIKANLATLNIR